MSEKCSLCEKGETTYSTLRVRPSTREPDKNKLIYYSGISANSWFTPCGISRKSQDVSYKHLPEELKSGIERRAKSASAILGRRYYESDHQNININECIEGKAIFETGKDEHRKDNKTKQGRYCGTSGESSYAVYKAKVLRPSTSYSANRSTGRTIPENYRSTARTTPGNDGLDQTLDNRSHWRSNVTWNKIGNSIQKCKEYLNVIDSPRACEVRAKSAPASLQKQGHGVNIGAREGKSTPRTPVYWRTRSDYQRRQIAERSDHAIPEQDTIFIPKGSLLKPMLYSNVRSLKHSAGCPYKCKGCFKACLVSSENFQKIKERKRVAFVKNKEVKSKLYYRRIVETALSKSQPINQLIQKKNA